MHPLRPVRPDALASPKGMTREAAAIVRRQDSTSVDSLFPESEALLGSSSTASPGLVDFEFAGFGDLSDSRPSTASFEQTSRSERGQDSGCSSWSQGVNLPPPEGVSADGDSSPAPESSVAHRQPISRPTTRLAQLDCAGAIDDELQDTMFVRALDDCLLLRSPPTPGDASADSSSSIAVDRADGGGGGCGGRRVQVASRCRTPQPGEPDSTVATPTALVPGHFRPIVLAPGSTILDSVVYRRSDTLVPSPASGGIHDPPPALDTAVWSELVATRRLELESAFAPDSSAPPVQAAPSRPTSLVNCRSCSAPLASAEEGIVGADSGALVAVEERLIGRDLRLSAHPLLLRHSGFEQPLFGPEASTTVGLGEAASSLNSMPQRPISRYSLDASRLEELGTAWPSPQEPRPWRPPHRLSGESCFSHSPPVFYQLHFTTPILSSVKDRKAEF
ncbi:unnamed protein product [Protopolystoma xenopodis]|uniref:Uncharacterized protein n=1 Tax=Protopolystoma xenopodis TaxID=117903 RepID=A0A3S5AXI3_9PLAT|nr:unnamed protein product [Protopolystoma xenopodis]